MADIYIYYSDKKYIYHTRRMPYHLELGSDGHKFHGKAIVVNSITGEHFSNHPIPVANAEAQKRVLEEAHRKKKSKD
jgi:hypothetical protein